VTLLYFATDGSTGPADGLLITTEGNAPNRGETVPEWLLRAPGTAVATVTEPTLIWADWGETPNRQGRITVARPRGGFLGWLGRLFK
jgi:hypothetical protein